VTEQERFGVFFAVWVVLGIGSGLFMWRASPEAKREWFPRFSILAGVLFVGFVYWVMPFPHILYFVVPATFLITVLNIRGTHFCGACGAFHQSAFGIGAANLCRKCGEALE
jgi:hypothetical protein